jgi:hypothetical protein
MFGEKGGVKPPHSKAGSARKMSKLEFAGWKPALPHRSKGFFTAH